MAASFGSVANMTKEPSITRSIHAYARDLNGRALPHTDFELTKQDGSPLGRVRDSHGQGVFVLPGERTPLNLIAIHGSEHQSALLSKDVDTWTFQFNWVVETTVMNYLKDHVPLIVGLVLLSVALILTFTFPTPTPLQSHLIRSTAALACGGIASVLTGMLRANVTLGNQLAVSATGAAAVYIISFFFVPAY